MCVMAALRKRLSPSGSVPNSGAVFHGNHMMIAMALGFLFMGGGNVTLCTSNQAVAALLISLFPRFPVAPTDNRCHLQVCWPISPSAAPAFTRSARLCHA